MFSFVIINYNTAQLCKNCLESIFKYCTPGDFEIILVDNNSKNEDVNYLRTRFGDSIKIIENKKNFGFAKANNQGATQAQGKYLFFLNSDTLIKENILAPLAQVLENDDKIGIIAPRLLLENGAEQIYSYKAQKNSPDLAWVSGAALIIRRDLFLEIGAWDERYFMYFEDVDLCRCALEKKYKVVRLTSVSVTHLVGGSPVFFWKRKGYYYHSKLLFILKHYFKF